MNTYLLKLLFSFLLLAILSCQENGAEQQQEIPEGTTGIAYLGQWTSVGPENLGNGTYGTRYFNLSEENWEVKFKLFLDSTLTIPVFQFRGVGKYQIQTPSAVLGGADDALFGFTHKFLTLLTGNQEVINSFGFASCALEMGNEKDITAEGCSFFAAKEVCGQEYDLLKLENNLLYFGKRPAEGDMCTEKDRPTALGYPLKKI